MMNRRDALKHAVGVPLSLAGVTAVTLAAPVTLESGSVRLDLSVFDHGDGVRFALTLLKKPWPKVGDRVRFEHQAMQLLGTVTGFSTESVRGDDRVLYHVQGTVQAFDAKATLDA